MSRQKPSREQQKRISAKIRKLINEGYEPDQAAAIAYEYSREHKLGPRGGVERNPISLNEKFILFVLPRMNLHISSWGDYSTTVSVENIIKHVIPSIHENIEHGNDIEFIGKKFFRKSSKPYNGIEPFVIEYKDKSGIAIYHKDEETLDYLIANMIIPEIHRYFPGEFESNPRHELEREFSTALYLLSKKPNLINQIPSNIKELFHKAGYVSGNQITEAGEKYLKFIKSRVAQDAVASNPSEDKITLLIDGAAGIYVPNKFYKNFDFKFWGLNKKDYSDLADPENEHYWDTWDDVLRNAEYKDKDGYVWSLYQDDSLFAIRDDYEFED